MKQLTIFQFKLLTNLTLVFLISANLWSIPAQDRNRNNSVNNQRNNSANNQIEILKYPNVKESDLLAAAFSDEQFFIGGRNGVLQFYDLVQSDKLGSPIDVSMSQDRYPIRQVFFRNNTGFVLKGNTIYNPRNGVWSGTYAHKIGGTPVLTPEFWNMDFADSNSACIVGVNLQKANNKEIVDSGLIICNHDLRNNPKAWLQPILPVDFREDKIGSQLTSISFDGNQGWLVGANGIIWRTENGGRVWESEVSNTENPLLNVYAISDNEAWAVGFGSTILHRSNKKSFTSQNDDSQKDNQKKNDESSSTDKEDQNKENDKGTLEKTKDRAKVVITNNIPQVKIITGDSEKIVTPTPQPGQTSNNKDFENNKKYEWKNLEAKENPISGKNIRLWAIKFAPDKRHGWIVGDSGTILYTNTGGERWSVVNLVQNVNGRQSLIFKTTQPLPNFYSMYIDNNYCWIVGSQGVILRMSY